MDNGFNWKDCPRYDTRRRAAAMMRYAARSAEDDHAAILAPDDHRRRRTPEEVARDLAPDMPALAKYVAEAELDLSNVSDPEAHARCLAGNLPAAVARECGDYDRRARRRASRGAPSLESIASELWPESGRRKQVEDELGPCKLKTVLNSVRSAVESGRPWPTCFGEMVTIGSTLTHRETIDWDDGGRFGRLQEQSERLKAAASTLQLRARYRKEGVEPARYGKTWADVVSPQEEALAVRLATRRGCTFEEALAELRS